MHVGRMVVAFLVGGLLTGPAVEPARAQVPPSLQYYSVNPCRVLDTRSAGQGPALASGTPRIVTVTGSCGIPATARAIAGIVTSAGPTGAGNLRLYAGDGAVPPTSALNFSSGQTRGNNGVFPLAANGTGTLAIRATVTGGGTVNVVLDVAGYFAAGPCPIELTVKNYLAWCSVSIAGGAASPAPTQTVCVAESSVVSLAAAALVGFQLGATPWHDTDGDTGSGDPGTRTGTGQSETASTTKTIGSSGTACAWVCCEFVSGGGCPATDQCP